MTRLELAEAIALDPELTLAEKLSFFVSLEENDEKIMKNALFELRDRSTRSSSWVPDETATEDEDGKVDDTAGGRRFSRH